MSDISLEKLDALDELLAKAIRAEERGDRWPACPHCHHGHGALFEQRLGNALVTAAAEGGLLNLARDGLTYRTSAKPTDTAWSAIVHAKIRDVVGHVDFMRYVRCVTLAMRPERK